MTTESSDNGDSNKIKINLTLTSAPSTPRMSIEVDESSCTSTELLNAVSTKTNIPRDQLKLIFRGRMIKDNDGNSVVNEFKLQSDCVVHCMGKPGKPSSTPPTSSSTTTTATPATTNSVSAPGASVTMTIPDASTPSQPSTEGAGDNSLQLALNKMKGSNTSDVYLTGVTTLEKIISNITEKPMEEKYRNVKKNNAAFQRRLGGITGGHDVMLSVGFTLQTIDGEEKYVMVPSADAWPKLVANKNTITQAVTDAKRSTATNSAPLGIGGGGGAPFPPAGGMGMGSMPPNMDAMMNNILSNPQQLQAMLSNPMVRQMMQNDPRFRDNPMMQQQLDMLMNNPQALQQISQMMSNPVIRQQMQQQMAGGMGSGMGGMGSSLPNANNDNMTTQQQMEQAMMMMMMGAGGGGAGSGSGIGGQQQQQQPNSSNSNNSNQPSGQDELAMTEEEMIAEAIRRSMEDNNNNEQQD